MSASANTLVWRGQTPEVRRLGRADYVATWTAMREFNRTRDPSTPDMLWVVEHPPVYTLGQAGKRAHILDPGNIPVVATDRGGQVTYHGPGQVVVYTLIDLRRLGIYAKEWVFRIENAVIQTLAAVGADGRRVAGAPGVFVPYPHGTAPGFEGLAKIAALGVKISNGCSYHGVALNVGMDLEPFNRINPCGYQGLPTVDLAKIGLHVPFDTVASQLVERLSAHLSA